MKYIYFRPVDLEQKILDEVHTFPSHGVFPSHCRQAAYISGPWSFPSLGVTMGVSLYARVG